MWSHYADAHKGFCIRYKLSTVFIKQAQGNGYSHKYLKRVHYLSKNEKCVMTQAVKMIIFKFLLIRTL